MGSMKTPATILLAFCLTYAALDLSVQSQVTQPPLPVAIALLSAKVDAIEASIGVLEDDVGAVEESIVEIEAGYVQSNALGFHQYFDLGTQSGDLELSHTNGYAQTVALDGAATNTYLAATGSVWRAIIAYSGVTNGLDLNGALPMGAAATLTNDTALILFTVDSFTSQTFYEVLHEADSE